MTAVTRCTGGVGMEGAGCTDGQKDGYLGFFNTQSTAKVISGQCTDGKRLQICT